MIPDAAIYGKNTTGHDINAGPDLGCNGYFCDARTYATRRDQQLDRLVGSIRHDKRLTKARCSTVIGLA